MAIFNKYEDVTLSEKLSIQKEQKQKNVETEANI